MKEKVYKGKILDLNIERAIMPDGREVELEIIAHPGGACILPVHENGDVTLIRQFRHAVGGTIWEVPAGRIDDGESPVETALRELKEETGLYSEKIEKLGEFLPTPGFCSEVVHLYIARNLIECGQQLEEDEYLEVVRLPFGDALEKVMKGEITDGKTVVSLFLAREKVASLSS